MSTQQIFPTSLHERTQWTGLSGSSSACALAMFLSQKPVSAVLVCATDQEAGELKDNLAFFLDLCSPLPSINLLSFPARSKDLEPALLEEPHVRMQRLSVLHAMLEGSPPTVVICSIQAAAQLTVPKNELIRWKRHIQVSQEMDRDEFVEYLFWAGYENEAIVQDKGDYAVRGAIIDIFPPHTTLPIRIEFTDNVIESIRSFDPTSQCSLKSFQEMTCFPCRELIWQKGSADCIQRRLKALADSKDLPPRFRLSVEESISEGRYTPSMDCLLPLFYDRCESLLDYAPPELRWILTNPLGIQRECEVLHKEFQQKDQSIEQQRSLTCYPSTLSISLKELENYIVEHETLEVSDILFERPGRPFQTQQFHTSLHTQLRQELLAHRNSESPLAPLLSAIRSFQDKGLQIILATWTEKSAHRLYALLSPYVTDLVMRAHNEFNIFQMPIQGPAITWGHLLHGFVWEEGNIVFVTETEIFGQRKHTAVPSMPREEMLSSFRDLDMGDYVVHIDHGIGIYRGLRRLVIANIANDFLLLEYAGSDKLYVPIHRLNRIHKYIGSDQSKPTVAQLGNHASWTRTKEKAKKAASLMASELIELYAARKIATGKAYGLPDESYLTFESDFSYEETPDQLQTLEDVSTDLEDQKPMDRLVCGDVGFGKTEIALRAAYRTTMEGKQVCVLVPTTVLCQQHFETFSKRFRSYPIEIDFLSRFKSRAEQKQLIERLQQGSLDIVIGTHRLLSPDVLFGNLGLLIVDEEHRFGVKHKEQIKRFRNVVNVLTLTATPIPRTLQLSMAGIRDLSVINTPPLDRKAIVTVVATFDDSLIRSVVEKELARDGQVFFVHNRVETIDAMKQYLSRLIPQARIAVAHGQMNGTALESVMQHFLAREFNVLLCTTIIESGLDIASANTIIIHRADCFGLAQLYQLRGRVGRSEQQAYAYLLIPGEDAIGKDAMKRLKALQQFTQLGSGLKIALHDLEIRGAGNLLGAQQSGHIIAVGFELFVQLLEKEVQDLKGEPVLEEIEPEIHPHIPAFLPDDYVSNSKDRLLLYKRLSASKTTEDLESLQVELVDRYGPLPPTAQNLFQVIDLKITAKKAGASLLQLALEKPVIEFGQHTPINIARLLDMVRNDPGISLQPPNRLILTPPPQADRILETKKILQALL